MCYAIPGKIVELMGKVATIDYFGEKRNAVSDLIEAGEGDYVYAQGGVVVDKISEEDAREILDFWKENFFKFKGIDEEKSRFFPERNVLDSGGFSLLQKINRGGRLSSEEMRAFMALEGGRDSDGGEALEEFFRLANNIRSREHGNASCVHGIIEFSNWCRNNCHYCGIRRDCKVPRYRMSPEEIVRRARDVVGKYGFKALVLQSGEDLWYTEEKLLKLVEELRMLRILIFMSIGERPARLYEKMYKAGARGVLMRFETANPRFFKQLRPGTSLDKRLELIRAIKGMGYVLATGFICGLPGETADDVIDNVKLATDLKADMYSFGPLIPTKGTPLENAPKMGVETLLKTIALTRFMHNDSNILVTTAMETLDASMREKALMSGANSMMVNLTPGKYADLYKIYDGKKAGGDSIARRIAAVTGLLGSLGRSPVDIGR